MLDVVLARLPLPIGAAIAIIVGDAASVIGDLAAATASFDVVVIDLYARLDAPEFVDTLIKGIDLYVNDYSLEADTRSIERLIALGEERGLYPRSTKPIFAI